MRFLRTEQTYGVSYLPGYGRDSYSSYRIADSTIGDGEDLVSASHKRDAEVLRSVERQMVSKLKLPQDLGSACKVLQLMERCAEIQ